MKEACLAIKLDRWSKEILATYLNQVYFGNHAYGIEAAAQTYFSKPRRSSRSPRPRCSPVSAAPSVYDPFQRPPRRSRAATTS